MCHNYSRSQIPKSKLIINVNVVPKIPFDQWIFRQLVLRRTELLYRVDMVTRTPHYRPATQEEIWVIVRHVRPIILRMLGVTLQEGEEFYVFENQMFPGVFSQILESLSIPI